VVTFLFTDVEGSTRRWEADADEMRSALAAHDELLHTVIDSHGGFLFEHTGNLARFAVNAFVSVLNARLRPMVSMNRTPGGG
jgi:class 3 adenylate cyclase